MIKEIKVNTAIILCAGYGKRLKPLTHSCPKPLLKINQNTLLKNNINFIKKIGVKKIFINSFFLKNKIKKYINRHNFNIPIKIINDGKTILGTGGGSLGGARYLNIPDIFRLAIVRVEATESEEGSFSAITPAGISKLVRYPTKVVLSDLKIDAAGDGQGYISLKNLADTYHDYGPVSMNLELTFKETQFVTREMISDN